MLSFCTIYADVGWMGGSEKVQKYADIGMVPKRLTLFRPRRGADYDHHLGGSSQFFGTLVLVLVGTGLDTGHLYLKKAQVLDC